MADDPTEKRVWFRRGAAFVTASGAADDSGNARADMVATRLHTLAPDDEVAVLEEAGFEQPALFYAALTFRGWVAYA